VEKAYRLKNLVEKAYRLKNLVEKPISAIKRLLAKKSPNNLVERAYLRYLSTLNSKKSPNNLITIIIN
jgi:hypothetical protein